MDTSVEGIRKHIDGLVLRDNEPYGMIKKDDVYHVLDMADLSYWDCRGVKIGEQLEGWTLVYAKFPWGSEWPVVEVVGGVNNG